MVEFLRKAFEPIGEIITSAVDKLIETIKETFTIKMPTIEELYRKMIETQLKLTKAYAQSPITPSGE